MRYYLRDSSLIVRGRFRACSSGTNGGIRDCTTLINREVPHNFCTFPDREVELFAASCGLDCRFVAGLLTAVPMYTLCILTFDNLTTFITAGITHPDPVDGDGISEKPSVGTINLILVTSERLSDQCLLDAMITATEAKVLAMREAGYLSAGTLTDAVIVATEDPGGVRYAGSATVIGQRIHESVLYGVQEAVARWSGKVVRTAPSFFIRSRIGGAHWVEWQKKKCPYYPCHYEGQRCDLCYCPLYPCGDTLLGDWISKGSRNPVWSCVRCTLNHDPLVTRHLKNNPEASLGELKALLNQK